MNQSAKLEGIRRKCIAINPTIANVIAIHEGGKVVVFKEREIRLADVLFTINNMMVVVDAWGNMYRLSMKLNDKLPRFDKKNPTAVWDLKNDDLSSQSPECIDFISSVLGV